MEACAVAMGAHRGREGNLVRTLIRPNGWCKVARSAERRQKTVDERGKREKEEKRKTERERKNTDSEQTRFWMDKGDESATGACIGIAGSRRGLGVRHFERLVRGTAWRGKR